MIPCESRFESNTGVSQGCERCRIYKSSTENTGFGSRDQQLKTKLSTRKLALYGALLDGGYLDYWRSLPVGGPLFPNVPLDTYGKRARSKFGFNRNRQLGVLRLTDATIAQSFSKSQGPSTVFKNQCIKLDTAITAP